MNGLSEYSNLAKVLGRAFSIASEGKGHERHGSNDPWEEQSSFVLVKYFKTPFTFQAAKKIAEGQKLDKEKRIYEYLQAINYLAMEIWREENENTGL